MRIGIIGGGINGLCVAWTLAERGYRVELFERDRLMQATSRASSKLLHGGLRYLEHAEFRLVREALRERDHWIDRVPAIATPLALVVPVYRGGKRKRWQYGVGLWLYRQLAGQSPYRDFEWIPTARLVNSDTALNPVGLSGGYRFQDGQMDDERLGLWVAEQARSLGAELHEHTPVAKFGLDGTVELASGEIKQFDRVVNVAGPWADHLAQRSGQASGMRLDLVRGSHLILDQPCPQAYLLEHPRDRRIFFVLPYQGQTLVGTTEVRQRLDEVVTCSDEEKRYLREGYAAYFPEKIEQARVVRSFSGLRPLLRSTQNPNAATREYSIHRQERAITVLGGKWTTARALAQNVAKAVK